MKVLIINQKEVMELLPVDICIDVMVDALKALTNGEVILPLRPVMWLPEKIGALGMMPAYMGSIQAMGLKVVSVFPGNHGTKYDSHMGTVMLFEAVHGQLLAIIDATEVTAIRTGAVSGVTTRLLARKDAGDLAILGSGTQARTHLDAMLSVRQIRRVRIWSRNTERARKFAEREGARHKIQIEVAESVQLAVQNADLICTVTAAPEPILKGEWIAPGAHINAVGSSVPFTRELDTAAIVKSSLFVDRRESAINEAGDFLFPKKEGAITDDHIRGEVGEVLLGKVPGRKTNQEITVFKSLGLAVEDVASAHMLYKIAQEKGKGTWIELGGDRHDDE